MEKYTYCLSGSINLFCTPYSCISYLSHLYSASVSFHNSSARHKSSWSRETRDYSMIPCTCFLIRGNCGLAPIINLDECTLEDLSMERSLFSSPVIQFNPKFTQITMGFWDYPLESHIIITNTHSCTHMHLCVSESLWLCFSEQIFSSKMLLHYLGCTLLWQVASVVAVFSCAYLFHMKINLCAQNVIPGR